MKIVVFKILMILCSVLSFIGSMVEKDTAKQKIQVAIFASAGILFLLRQVGTNLIP